MRANCAHMISAKIPKGGMIYTKFSHIKLLWFLAFSCILQCTSSVDIRYEKLVENNLISSGPVFVIDTRTLFATNLKWINESESISKELFFQGRTSSGRFTLEYTDINRVLHEAALRKFQGEDLYLQLPAGYSLNAVKNILVASKDGREMINVLNIGDVEGVPQAEGYHEYSKEGTFILRYPKCCENSMDPAEQKCGDHIIEPDDRFNVYKGNQTMLDDVPLEKVIPKPYLRRPQCSEMYPLHPHSDSFYYLSEGILLYLSKKWTKDEFCFDIHQIDNVHYETPFVCFTDGGPRENPELVNVIYVIGIFISALGLIITCAIFIFVKSAREGRGWNVIGYTLSTAAAFVCLASARLLHVDGETCKWIAILYQYLVVCSFTWLNALIIDTYLRVRFHGRDLTDFRKIIYLICAIGLPLATVLVSYQFGDLVPSFFSLSPNIYEACWFRSDKKVFFYYLPIFVLMLVNVIFILITCWQLCNNQDLREITWTHGRYNVKMKNVHRSNYCLTLIMLCCWIAEVATFYIGSDNTLTLIIDVITTLQGLFVLFIFIYHEPVYTVMKKRCCNCSKKVAPETRRNYQYHEVRPQNNNRHYSNYGVEMNDVTQGNR